MTRQSHILFATLCAGLLGAPATYAQVVEVAEGPAQPAAEARGAPLAAPLDQPPFARLYVNVVPGRTTALNEAKSEDGTAPLLPLDNFHYSAFDVLISATSLFLEADTRDSRRGDIAALNQLTRMTAHVSLEGIAADKTTVVTSARHDPSVFTLQMSPSNMRFGKVDAPSALEATVTRAVTDASRLLGPVGGLIETFVGARHHPAGPAFFSYQSADNEFGWNWYLSPETTVEGIHRGSALLQIRKDVPYVRVTISLATDWSHHGVWKKQYSFLVAVPAPASGPASATESDRQSRKD